MKRAKKAATKRVAKRSAKRVRNVSPDVGAALSSSRDGFTAGRNVGEVVAPSYGKTGIHIAQLARRWSNDAGISRGDRAAAEKEFAAGYREGADRKTNPRIRRTKKVVATKKRARRRNSAIEGDGAREAKKLYRKFHQTGSHGHRDVAITTAVPTHLAQLGRLIEVHVAAPKGNFVLAPKGVTLTSTPDGKQMYFVGGDQVPPLSQLGVDGSKVHVCLGTLKKIVYLTRKGFHNFEPVEYVHRMGEEGGVPPELNYDTQSKLLYLVGGTYRVKPAGITN